jgi:hypothetical protein
MIQHRYYYPKFWLICLSTLISVSFSNASAGTMVRVIKSKQGKSLIIYKKDTQLKPGIYQLTDSRPEYPDDIGPVTQKDRFISLSFDSSFLKQKTTVGSSASAEVDVKTLNSNLVYGWNKGGWEWGAFLSYSFNTVGPVDVKTLVAGLLYDCNFSPNTLESEYVFGLRLYGGMGQEDSSSYKSAAQVTLLQPSLFLKWFGLSPNLGLTTELGFQMRESKIDQTTNQTQGTFVRLGVANYF